MKYRYPALVLLLGVGLLLLPGGRSGKIAEVVPAAQTADFDLEGFTARAEALLSRFQGAGQVHLLLTLDTQGRTEYLMEEQTDLDADRESRRIQAVLPGTGGTQEPVAVERQSPKFRGAVVICPGGDSPGVALGLKEAVSCLTGLGLDKITVLKSHEA